MSSALDGRGSMRMGMLRLAGLLHALFCKIFPVRLQRSYSNIQQLMGVFLVDFRYVLCACLVVGKGFSSRSSR